VSNRLRRDVIRILSGREYHLAVVLVLEQASRVAEYSENSKMSSEDTADCTRRKTEMKCHLRK